MYFIFQGQQLNACPQSFRSRIMSSSLSFSLSHQRSCVLSPLLLPVFCKPDSVQVCKWSAEKKNFILNVWEYHSYSSAHWIELGKKWEWEQVCKKSRWPFLDDFCQDTSERAIDKSQARIINYTQNNNNNSMTRQEDQDRQSSVEEEMERRQVFSCTSYLCSTLQLNFQGE